MHCNLPPHLGFHPLYDARVGSVRDVRQDGAEGFILVGGRSSRFGTDKAIHLLEGRPMVLHVADALRPYLQNITLVGDPAAHGQLGLPVIADIVAGAGPLGGIVSALDHARCRFCLVVGCDMPRIGSAPLSRLLDVAVTTGVDALVPKTPDGRLQPLCAVYAKQARAPLARALRDGRRKITDALDSIRWEAFPVDQISPFVNINYFSDLHSFS